MYIAIVGFCFVDRTIIINKRFLDIILISVLVRSLLSPAFHLNPFTANARNRAFVSKYASTMRATISPSLPLARKIATHKRHIQILVPRSYIMTPLASLLPRSTTVILYIILLWILYAFAKQKLKKKKKTEKQTMGGGLLLWGRLTTARINHGRK